MIIKGIGSSDGVLSGRGEMGGNKWKVTGNVIHHNIVDIVNRWPDGQKNYFSGIYDAKTKVIDGTLGAHGLRAPFVLEEVE